jgi:hypothetical protein
MICFPIVIFGTSCAQDQAPDNVLAFSPEEPLPGESIRVTYTLEETALAAADAVASEADLDEHTMNTLVNCYRQLKNSEK